MCKGNVKRFLLTALAVVLTVSVIATVAVNAKRAQTTFVLPDTSSAETSTNRHTQYATAVAISGKRLTTDGYKLVLQNDAMEMWIREETAALRVVDKKSGYIWGQLPTDTVDNLNDYWMGMAKSMLTLEYYDTDNNSYQISLCDSRFDCTYTYDDAADTMTCDAICEAIGIDISFTVELKDDHLEANIVKDSLQEYDETVKISKLYLLPFFGSTTKSEMSGYFFVPDGSGALMRFDSNMMYNSIYSAKIYGSDIGIDTVNQVTDLVAKRTDDYLVDEYRATIPVYGVVHGADQYAAMTVVTGGKEYANIQASLASATVPYNWIATCFEYRQLYNQPVSKSKTVLRPQPKINNCTPKISIYLLSGSNASYSGMAVKYRSLLEKDGTLEAVADAYKDQVPLRLEVAAADTKAGFIFNGTTTFTTVDQMKQMQTELKDMNINNLTMVVNGWQKGGSNGSKYGKFTTQKSVGSISELADLRDAITKAGGTFYLQTKAVTLNKSQGKLAYISDMTLSKKLAYYLRDNATIMFPETYIAAPNQVVSTLQSAITALKDFNLNLPRFGSELYADYQQDYTISRAKTRNMFEDVAEKVQKSGAQISMSTPNQYLWKNCSDYFDVPMMNSQFIFESDSVPFLQILLKGHIHYYAPFANQGFYTTSCTLKSIEYGAYPSFLVMGEDNSELNRTPMEDFFSLNFEDWKGTIDTVYNKINAALKEVEGANISEHKVLATGVVRVTYTNGVKIYVNYNSDDCTVDGIKVSGLDFAVGRG